MTSIAETLPLLEARYLLFKHAYDFNHSIELVKQRAHLVHLLARLDTPVSDPRALRALFRRAATSPERETQVSLIETETDGRPTVLAIEGVFDLRTLMRDLLW